MKVKVFATILIICFSQMCLAFADYDEVGPYVFLESFDNLDKWILPVINPPHQANWSFLVDTADGHDPTADSNTVLRIQSGMASGAAGVPNSITMNAKNFTSPIKGDSLLEYWLKPSFTGSTGTSALCVTAVRAVNAEATPTNNITRWFTFRKGAGNIYTFEWDGGGTATLTNVINQWNKVALMINGTTGNISIYFNDGLLNPTGGLSFLDAGNTSFRGLLNMGINQYKWGADFLYDDISIRNVNTFTPSFTTTSWTTNTTTIQAKVDYHNYGSSKDVVAMLELYDSNNVMQKRFEQANAILSPTGNVPTSGTIDITATIDESVQTAVKAKLFVFDGVSAIDSSLTPYCDVVTLTKEGY